MLLVHGCAQRSTAEAPHAQTVRPEAGRQMAGHSTVGSEVFRCFCTAGASEGQGRARCGQGLVPPGPCISVGATWQETSALSEGGGFVSEGQACGRAGAPCPCAASLRPAASAARPFCSLHRLGSGPACAPHPPRRRRLRGGLSICPLRRGGGRGWARERRLPPPQPSAAVHLIPAHDPAARFGLPRTLQSCQARPPSWSPAALWPAAPRDLWPGVGPPDASECHC